MRALNSIRRWLGRIIAGDSAFERLYGIGSSGSAADVCGQLSRAAHRVVPAAVHFSTGCRRVSDLSPGEMRIVVEVGR